MVRYISVTKRNRRHGHRDFPRITEEPMFSDTFRNSELKDTLFSSRSDYRLHGYVHGISLLSSLAGGGRGKGRGIFFRGKKIGSVDVAASAAALLNSPLWKEKKKEEQNREERRIERNSKRKTVRHSIIKRENEYGVLSAQSHDDNFQRGKRTVVSRLRVP